MSMTLQPHLIIISLLSLGYHTALPDLRSRLMPLGVFYKLVFMFLSGCLFCLDDFGLSFASVSFSISHDARIAPSFIKDICCMIASKSPQANL